MRRNKGSKRKKWLKDGMTASKKHYKPIWNRKIRHAKCKYCHCEYKRIAKDSIYTFVL